MKERTLYDNFATGIQQAILLVVFAAAVGIGFNVIRSNPLQWVDVRSKQAQLTELEGLSISLSEAFQHYKRETAIFLDARNPNSFESGHIKGAINMPFQKIDDYFYEFAQTTLSDTFIITYCDGINCNLSHELALFLTDMGFTNVKVLVNGWAAWQAAEFPVENQGNG
jgi:rhodanese-related sulfurtransferase